MPASESPPLSHVYSKCTYHGYCFIMRSRTALGSSPGWTDPGAISCAAPWSRACLLSLVFRSRTFTDSLPNTISGMCQNERYFSGCPLNLRNLQECQRLCISFNQNVTQTSASASVSCWTHVAPWMMSAYYQCFLRLIITQTSPIHPGKVLNIIAVLKGHQGLRLPSLDVTFE